MPKKIGKRRVKVYLAEHRAKAKLTQEALAAKLRTTAMTVSRWEREETLMTTATLADVAHVLSVIRGVIIEPEDLFHHPDKPSANQLLRGQPPDVVDAAMRMLGGLRK